MAGTLKTLVLLQDPSIYLGSWDPAFIRTQALEPRRLLQTQHLFETWCLIELLGYQHCHTTSTIQ